jgi:hypothetical protein
MPSKKSQENKKRRGVVSAIGWSKRAEVRSSRPHCIELPKDIQPFEIKEAGGFNIDIIPFELGADSQFGDEGDLYFEKTYFSHQGIGIRMGSYACLSSMSNEPCPCCEYGQTMPRDTKSEKDLANKMFPKHRQLWIVWDHNDRKAGPKIWDVSYHLFGKILKAKLELAEEDDDWGLFHDPTEGLTIRCLAEEKTFAGRTFYSVEAVDFKTRKVAIPDRFLDHDIDLDSCIVYTPYDELSDVLNAAPPKVESDSKNPKDDDDDDDSWEDEDEPKRKIRKKRRPAEDDDDETPRRRKRRRKPVEDVDLDDVPFDLDDDDDDDEDNTKSKRRRRRR